MSRLLPWGKRRKLPSNHPEPASDQSAISDGQVRLSPGPAFPAGNAQQLSFPDGIKVLHDCSNANVDICFVHGLTGNRETTWTADGQSTSWPESLLPSELKNARILTFGYDANVIGSPVASSNRLRDHATNLLGDLAGDRADHGATSRPIIFVGHSLGGLLCKAAVLQSRNNADVHFSKIFPCTIGIIFMGTPHGGAELATWGKRLASAVSIVKSSNKDILEVLQTKNQYLESIQLDFLNMLRESTEGKRKLQVTCFFEELPVLGVGHIVSKASATFDGYTFMSIRANHSNMVKFPSKEDNGFVRVVRELRRWQNQLVGELEMRQPSRVHPSDNTKQESVHCIPHSKNHCFTGRQDKLSELKTLVFEDGSGPHIALVGLGGIGKTQVALELAYWTIDNKPDYSTAWISASTTAGFEKACRELLDKLGVRSNGNEDTKALFKRYLNSTTSGNWLIIIDNADDIKLLFGTPENPDKLYSFIPSRQRCKILFTTRSIEVASAVAGKDVIELSEMRIDEGESLLKALLRQPHSQSATAVLELLTELVCLPLAIVQAAAYMNTKRISIQKYLRLFRNTDRDMVELLAYGLHGQTTDEDDAQRAVATTWIPGWRSTQRQSTQPNST